MLPLLDKKKTCGAQTATAGVAGMAGIEPARAESKSAVLPLDYIPIRAGKPVHGSPPLTNKDTQSPVCPVVFVWGGRWDSNPRSPEPQSGALTN